MPKERPVDIDYSWDLKLAKVFMKEMLEKRWLNDEK